jgi:mono/diheme cytochrome c family protein
LRPAASAWIGLTVTLLLWAGSMPTRAHATEPSPADAEFFEKEVRPLLVERCLECHGEEKPKSGLKLTSRANVLKGGTRGPAVVAGKPEESLLLKALRHDDDLRMPPKDKLSDKQIAVLTRWVKSNLPWPTTSGTLAPAVSRFTITEKQRQFWSFQPVKSIAIPAVRDTAWPNSAVDRFIMAKLEAKQLAPAAPADKRTLLRRATFDLIGLPPTPDEIDSFLKDDSPQAFATVVDRLLASPQYGERWGRHWLDVVRYADARDLIQLPPPSDFREIWRYRDWVVESFNRDLPYTDFIRHQIAGDLLPPTRPGGINKDGLIATGMLALADFVPGDVDKEQMIADYVNDEIDVVGRAFLGLSVACARCHDHKFDPISTEDYYALAGIFFSTRLVPGPVPGNTPLVRAPLLSEKEIGAVKAQEAADQRRRAEIELQLRTGVDREYLAYVKPLIREQSSKYLIAASQHRQTAKTSLSELAKQHQLQVSVLTKWVEYLARIEKQAASRRPATLHDAATGKLTGAELKHSVVQLQQAIAVIARRRDAEPPEKNALARASLLRLRADDPDLKTDASGRVTHWPNRSGLADDAKPPTPDGGPLKTSMAINGHNKQVLRFDGRALLESPGRVPPNGSMFIVFQNSDKGSAGQRLVGWEDADVGKHGLGLMLDPGGRMHAIVRNNGQSDDLVDTRPTKGFEIVAVTWGPGGTSLFRDATAVGTSKGIDAISSDPGIAALHIGGPGSGGSPRFRGDVAEVRVYDRQLTDEERKAVQAELHDTWFEETNPKARPSDPLADWYDELLSPRGPFWVSADERIKLLSPEVRASLARLTQELEALKKKKPLVIPEAVVVGEGGPKGTRHEGFKDANVFVRGDHKKLGKSVPRGFPQVLAGDRREKITTGSGRLQLADWLARADSPLVARVMVNRIWQHHFGEGLVRTANDFGERGERPTHPELLDYLAERFVESGWSMKSMHRLIMLSSTYQQSSHAGAESLAADPENRLLGRFNRQRLDAEAIRDSLLAVSSMLDNSPGGPAFTELTKPRRTLYLMSARTGANTSDFGRLFDRADPGSIVAQRGQSIIAPQALFFLNDPFVSEMARALAARIGRVGGGFAQPTSATSASEQKRIERLYLLALSRLPTPAELDLGKQLLMQPGKMDSWERYCHLILCANEFIYVD